MSNGAGQPDELAGRLDYRFTDPGLLTAAVTHRSAGGRHNERLEFLGDAVLNFVIADAVFHRRPEEPEGTLSRLRANLVNQTTLAAIAREVELGECLRLGGGELKSGGHRRDSILSDALEAVLGAVYLDGGFEVAARVIRQLYSARLEHLPGHEELKDPKTRLQEKLQGQRRALPSYRVVEVSGKAHRQNFRVECRLQDGNGTMTVGEASSRRRAEQQAAHAMLIALEAESTGEAPHTVPGEGP